MRTTVRNAARLLVRAVVRPLQRLADPVCQDWGAVIYGDYGGQRVRLVPLVDSSDPCRIADWIPAVAQVALVDRENEKARLLEKDDQQDPDADDAPTGDAGGFNPARVLGL